MSLLLVLRAPARSALEVPVPWALVGPDGVFYAEGEIATGQAPDLSAVQEGPIERALLILPAGEVFVARLRIPAKTEREARQAAPFLLEDRLAAPLEAVETAIGPADETGARWAFAADKDLVAAWRRLAQGLGVKPVHALPDALLLSGHGGDLTLARLNAAILYQTRPADIGRRFREGLDPDEPVLEPGTVDDRILCGAAPAELAETILPALGAAVKPQRLLISRDIDPNWVALEGQPLALKRIDPPNLAAAAAALPAGALAGLPALLGAHLGARIDWGGLLKPWTRAAALAAAVLTAWTGLALMEGAYYAQRSGAYEDVVRQAFAEAFPEAPVIDPARQLRERVSRLDGGATAQFLTLSAALQEIAADVETVRIDTLRFDAARGALIVDAVYADFGDFELLRAAAEARNLAIEDQGSRQSDEGIAGGFILGLSR